MKYLNFNILIILFLILFSCSKIDDRLDGLYILDIIEDKYGTFKAEKINIYEELHFKRNTIKEIKKVGDKIFENDFKIKIILTKDNGGTFYQIYSFYSNADFDDSSKRIICTYTFVDNDFILEKEGEIKLYKRK